MSNAIEALTETVRVVSSPAPIPTTTRLNPALYG